MLSKKLELNNEQKYKVYAINLEQAKNREAFKKEAKEEVGERFKSRKESLKDSDEKLKTVLTAEQKEKYDELKKQRREQSKEKRGNRHYRRHK